MGVNTDKVQLFPDLALFNSEIDATGAEFVLSQLCDGSIPRLAGTTLMPWSFPGTANPKAEMARYLDKIASVIRLFHARTGIKTLLLRQIRDDRGFRGDGHLIDEMAKRLPAETVCSPEYLEPPLLRGVIARCEVFWGSRMHSNIFAATQRVPVVTVAYQHKAQGIMQMLGLGDNVVWIDSFEPIDLVDRIDAALANVNNIRDTLDSNFSKIEPQWNQLVRFFREAVHH
jgi:colanic acid/amylovoran biosynthesis protein